MKFIGKIYDDRGNKICEFTAKSRDMVYKNEIVIDNRITFENYQIHEFDIVKIAQLFKAICEMI